MSDQNEQRRDPSERERARRDLADRIGFLVARYWLRTKNNEPSGPSPDLTSTGADSPPGSSSPRVKG
jgi:hypothetical protein